MNSSMFQSTAPHGNCKSEAAALLRALMNLSVGFRMRNLTAVTVPLLAMVLGDIRHDFNEKTVF